MADNSNISFAGYSAGSNLAEMGGGNNTLWALYPLNTSVLDCGAYYLCIYGRIRLDEARIISTERPQVLNISVAASIDMLRKLKSLD